MLKRVNTDDILLREGSVDKHLYKVLAGRVVVYSRYGEESETIIGILSEGNFFGELGIFTGEPSIYTVIAYDDALILSIDEDELNYYLKQNHNDAIDIMTNMAYAMLRLKNNIDMLSHDIAGLVKNIDDTKKSEELKNRIKQSDIRKAMMMYSNLSTK